MRTRSCSGSKGDDGDDDVQDGEDLGGNGASRSNKIGIPLRSQARQVPAGTAIVSNTASRAWWAKELACELIINSAINSACKARHAIH